MYKKTYLSILFLLTTGFLTVSHCFAQQNPRQVSSELRSDLLPEGKATISGTVELPLTDKRGDLYVTFSPSGQAFHTADDQRYFTVIKKENIISSKVTYKIKNVPSGNYWGYATWDIAEPFWESSWGEGNCPGYAGDYIGGSSKIIVLDGETLNNVDIKCDRYLTPIVESNYGKEYKIIDLKYEKDLRDNKPKLFLLIKNTDTKPIQEITLNCFINGQKTLDFYVSGAGSLLDQGEQKELDMAYCYNSYLNKLFDKETLALINTNLSISELDVKLVSKDNSEVFEKRISLPDIKAKIIKEDSGDDVVNYKIIYE